MMSVDVACKRGQGAIGHADGDGRHVLEVIRHGEQKDVHTVSNVLKERSVARNRVQVECGDRMPTTDTRATGKLRRFVASTWVAAAWLKNGVCGDRCSD